MCSLAIKLGNSNCRLALASLTEWGGLSVNCINGADEQFATKTMFTIKSNRRYSEGFEHCFAGSEESDPVNIIFDALNVHHSNSPLYMDQEFGNIFAQKEKNGNYKLEFWEDGDRRERTPIVQFKDIEVIAAKLLNLAREHLPDEGPIQQIVITIPSFAKYEYREKLLKVMKIVGLPPTTDVQLMDQITAVAIAYRQKEGDKAQGHVLFFYMGAKSTEFAVFNFLDGQTPEIIFSNGFVDFGGENFTHSLVGNQMAKLKKEEREKWRKMSTEEKRGVYRNVRQAMEKIKGQLGCKELTTVKIDLGPTFRGRQFKIERKQYEEICKEECQKLGQFIGQAFNQSKNLPIKRVVLAGNSSKLYLVQKFIAKQFPSEMIMPMNALAPELAVVHGAAFKGLAEAFIGSKNAVPKCLSQALLPNIAFYGIYGKKYMMDLPYYVAYSGGKLPTKEVSTFFYYMDSSKWYEEANSNSNGKNDKLIMEFPVKLTANFGIFMDKNGLLQIRDSNGKLLEKNDLELETARKRFMRYQADVLRLKKEEEDWEEKRKMEMRKRLQKELKDSEEEESRKKIKIEMENGNFVEQKQLTNCEEKINRKNDGRKGQRKCRQNLMKEEIVPENEGNFVDKNDFEKSFSTNFSATAECSNSNSSLLVDILVEYNDETLINGVSLLGSWDNWNGRVPMEYSQLTNSYIAIVQLQPFDEYELLFESSKSLRFCEKNNLYVSTTYPSRYSQKLNSQVNVINLNWVQNVGNLQGQNNQNEKLKKIIAMDNEMLGIKNEMKEKQRHPEYIDKFMNKYMEIRNALQILVINNETLKTMIDEMDKAKTYWKIINHYLNWRGIEEQSGALNNSENAKAIRLEMKQNLVDLTASREEIISIFINYFCEGLNGVCRQIGLKQKSKELQELKKMMNTDFSNNCSIE